MSGIIGGAGSKSNIVGYDDNSVDSWHVALPSNVDHTSSTILNFDTEIHIGSNISESGGVITIGTAGWYWIVASFNNNSGDDQVQEFYFCLNGSINTQRSYLGGAAETDYLGQSIAMTVELAVTETVAWKGTGTLYGAAAPNIMSYHMGYRLGA